MLIALPTTDGDLVVRATDGQGAQELVGMHLGREESKAGRVLARRRSERIDSMLDDVEVDHEVSRLLEARTGLYVPMILRDRPIGIIAAHDRDSADRGSPDEDVRLAEAFAARAAVAATSPNASPGTRSGGW